MVALTADHYLSPEEYLEFEKHSDIKHEYIDGEIYAMAGASNAHNKINTNLLVSLSLKLRGSNCQPYSSDMKVRVQEGRRFFYPDLLVSCNPEIEDLTAYAMDHPRLIIEILSESTEGFDRGNKFKFYRTIPSLQEYILVSTTQYSVDCFRRGEGDLWILESYQGQEALLKLQSLDLEISLADIYATVTLPETDDDLEGDFSE